MNEAIQDLSRWERAAAIAAFAIFAAFLLYRLPLGYGHDRDAYLMLGAWQHMLAEGQYVPSRFPGYIVAEFALGMAATLGGAMGSNALVALLSIGSLWATYAIGRELEVDKPLLLPALMAACPYVAIAASSSMDYMIAYALLASGMLLCLRGGMLWGIVLLAAAGGARLTNWALAAAFLIWLARRRDGEGWYGSVAALTLVTGLFYLPVWISAHLGFGWLSAALPDDQGLFGLLARFAYKVVQPFGLIGTLAAGALLLVQRERLQAAWRDPVFRLGLLFVTITLLIFARAPIEISYLIFAIPFLGLLLLQARLSGVLVLLIAGGLFAGVLHVDLIAVRYRDTGPCGPVMAEGARFAPGVGTGVLLAEIADARRWDRCFNRRPLLVEPYATANSPLPVPPHVARPRFPRQSD
ncbi:MAG: hypothetical protein KAY22_03890 [Rhizorhabdus sp.]|jgi:hypothetical protein|uniref:hypothetical protein n=2 Tax=Rhizorhabdus sp. TaxID=1968843 RepID=UPI001B757BB5|nr:hypothetical protein [Rhizorhabdus sp.]MBP8231425.1 hypothetical protein [Rhizorhabdus sp.]